MRVYDIIEKKRDGKELSLEEIKYLIEGYTNNSIPDYQFSAFLMAIYFKGMTNTETEYLTQCMLNSGNIVDLSPIKGIKIDKHSTGGVGDKTTLIIAPIVAICGGKVAKMSGRSLGYTGGTIDKLESLDGLNTAINEKEFCDIVNKIGCCVVSQTGNLVPADKKIYALRDLTATVESIPLIASSIMSKKIASGADCIVLDVKVGEGAFMKNINDAINLSKLMVSIGTSFNKKVTAFITNMDEPLGNAIGNFVEIWETCQVLNGKGPEDLKNLCIDLSSEMLYLSEIGDYNHCKIISEDAMKNGTALEKFKSIVNAQGFQDKLPLDENYINKSKFVYELKSDFDGYISYMKTSNIGKAVLSLGAGREIKNQEIDNYAGIILNKKLGDKVNKNELLATFYTSDFNKFEQAVKIFKSSIKISEKVVSKKPLIQAKIDINGVIIY